MLRRREEEQTISRCHTVVDLCSSLTVEANVSPLNLIRQKLSLQYALRLSSNYQNPAYRSLTQNLAGFSEQT